MAILEKKFQLLLNDNIKIYDFDRPIILYRIQATRDFGIVKKGDKGGYLESEDNLSQYDTCWVGGHAKVWGDARVTDQARVLDNARVNGRALVYEEAIVSGNARITDKARIGGYARVGNDKQIGGFEVVKGSWADALVSKGGTIMMKTIVVILGIGSIFLAGYCTYMLFLDGLQAQWIIGLITAPIAAYYSIVISSTLYT